MSDLIDNEAVYRKDGSVITIGIDEAGRGPLAGPVVCCSACFLSEEGMRIPEIRDSKLITSEAERERIYEVLQDVKGFMYKTSVISPEVIDDINILQATMKGMRESCHELVIELIEREGLSTPLALVDGNRVPAEMPIEAQAIIGGDSKSTNSSPRAFIANFVSIVALFACGGPSSCPGRLRFLESECRR